MIGHPRSLPSMSALGLGIVALAAGFAAPFAPKAMAPLVGLAAILAVIPMVRDRDLRSLHGHGVGLAVAVLAAWMAASAMWAIDAPAALRTGTGKAAMLIIVLVVAAMAMRIGDRDRQWLGGCLIAGFAVMVVFLAAESLSEGWLMRAVAPSKLRGAAWNDALISRGLVIMALMLWPALIALRRHGVWPAVAAALAAAVVAWLGAHHATRFALIAGLVALILVFRFGRPAVLAIGALGVVCILIAPALTYGPLSPDIGDNPLWPFKSSAIHRLYIWQFVSERIWERPLLGWGIGMSRYIPGGGGETPVGGTLIGLHPHSALLQVWLELGVIGAVAAAAMVAGLTWRLARLDADRFTTAAATAAFAAAFAVASIGFGVWQSWWMATLGVLAAWVVAITGRIRSENGGEGAA